VAMTTRAKAIVSSLTAVVLVGGAVAGYLIFTGKTDGIPFLGGDRRPVVCPLTGEEATNEALAERTVVAVKIENISESRPQAGLNEADIVYEQPVEGGITRFIALYQCENATRLGPIRSARFVDPNVLVQYGPAIFGYSGAIPQVVSDVADTGLLQDVSQEQEADAYELDPNRSAPHNVYSSTKALLAAASDRRSAPESVFEFSEEPPARKGSKRAREVRLPFSSDADVVWRYQRAQGRYVRLHGETPHTAEDGEQVSTQNIVVMMIRLRDTGIIDAAGNPSPEVEVVGSGPVYVIRDGRVIEGTWQRPTLRDTTRFVDRNGDTIPLSPGRTWVELFPNDLEPDIG
jgi:hypothetical protein